MNIALDLRDKNLDLGHIQLWCECNLCLYNSNIIQMHKPAKTTSLAHLRKKVPSFCTQYLWYFLDFPFVSIGVSFQIGHGFLKISVKWLLAEQHDHLAVWYIILAVWIFICITIQFDYDFRLDYEIILSASFPPVLLLIISVNNTLRSFFMAYCTLLFLTSSALYFLIYAYLLSSIICEHQMQVICFQRTCTTFFTNI